MINSEYPILSIGTGDNIYTVRVMGRRDLVTIDGKIESHLYLQNISGELKAILKHDRFAPSKLKFTHGDLITISGRELRCETGHWIDVEALSINLSPNGVSPEHLIPIEVVLEGYQDYARALCDAWNCIRDISLREFLIDVFTPCDVIMGFLTVPASTNYHHAYQCGLLVHTVEMLQEVFRMHRYTKPSTERDRLMTLCIIHDLGKIRTMVGRSHNMRGQYQPHDFATLEMLAPSIERLEARSMVNANLIRGYFKPKDWSPKKCLNIYKEISYLDNL